MGRFGYPVIDADGHGGEPRGWRRRIPDAFLPQMREYVGAMRAQYKGLPGGGQRAEAGSEAAPDDELEFDASIRPGMVDPGRRVRSRNQLGTTPCFNG